MKRCYYQIKEDRIWVYERRLYEGYLQQKYIGSITISDAGPEHVLEELRKKYKMIVLSDKMNYEKCQNWYDLESRNE